VFALATSDAHGVGSVDVIEARWSFDRVISSTDHD
jgi:hypothetical protein